MSCCTVASFARLLRLVNCLFIFMAASSKFVTDAKKVVFMSAGMEKGVKYSQDQSSIILGIKLLF